MRASTLRAARGRCDDRDPRRAADAVRCISSGFPFETADTDELNYRKSVRETMLRGVANSRFALYHHIVRRETLAAS